MTLMAFKLRSISKALFFIVSLVYPVAVFYLLVIKKAPIRLLSLFVMAFALIAFIAGTSKKKLKLSHFYGVPCSSSA